MHTHLSLFSGIGGLDLAAEMAGFRTAGQCEWLRASPLDGRILADGAGDPQDNNKRAEPGRSVKGAGERRVLEAVLPDLPGNYGGRKTWMTSNQPCWAIKRRGQAADGCGGAAAVYVR